MRGLKSLFSLDRLSILQRVFGGICIILLLLVALSVNSWRTIAEVYDKAGYVDLSVTETAAVTQLAAQASETRAQVTQYALSENENDLRAANRSLEQLQDEIDTVASAYAWAASDGDTVNKLRGLVDQYKKSVVATIDTINARRTNGTKLVESATELSTTVAAIVEALAHDTTASGALDDAIRLMEAFHSSDASATRFLASRDPADADTVRVDVKAMSRSLQALQRRNIDNPRVKRFLNAMTTPFQQYENAIDGLITTTERFARVAADRNAASATLIDAADQIRLKATEVQLGTVRGMMLSVASARRLGYMTSILAIVVGLGLAFVIGIGIARPIRQITAVMRKLADGTTDVAIP